MIKSILSALLLSSICYSSDLNFSFSGDVGYIPKGSLNSYRCPDEYRYLTIKETFSLSMRPQLEWKFLYGKLNITSFSCPSKSKISQTPIRVVWGNEIGFIFKLNSNIKMNLAWDHNCYHQVATYIEDDKNRTFCDIGYDQIKIGFHYK